MRKSINIAIAEDHRLVRQGFVRMLSDYPNISILFEAENGKELLKYLKEHKPSIILLDIAMPILSGIKAMEIIKQRFPKLKIIVISSFSEEISIVEYVKWGAHSFLNKNCDVEELVTAIYALDQNGTYFNSQTQKLLIKHGLLPGLNKRNLSEKEIAILKHICEDKTPQDIADATGLKISTIYFYEHRILQKTNCKDVSELINYSKTNPLYS
jgi:DNA-binding NarL/FixJ family response regulator